MSIRVGVRYTSRRSYYACTVYKWDVYDLRRCRLFQCSNSLSIIFRLASFYMHKFVSRATGRTAGLPVPSPLQSCSGLESCTRTWCVDAGCIIRVLATLFASSVRRFSFRSLHGNNWLFYDAAAINVALVPTIHVIGSRTIETQEKRNTSTVLHRKQVLILDAAACTLGTLKRFDDASSNKYLRSLSGQ